MEEQKINNMKDIIDKAYDIIDKASRDILKKTWDFVKQMYSYSYSDSLLEEEKKLKNMIDLFITKFYMLNPNVNHLNNFLSTNVNYEDDHLNPKLNYIIKDIRIYFYSVFEAYYEIDIEGKKKIDKKIMDYAITIVEKFITLIKQAPEKIPINEKKIARIRKECTAVLEMDDSAKVHEVLENIDNVVFLIPAPRMRPNTVNPVAYNYLAFTYPKKFIKTWLKDPKRIQYCDTDELNFEQDAIPYILCPLSFNCNPAYVKLSQILHVIHSKQRIFYILPSYYSDGSKHVCMKENPESQEIIRIAICDGDDCWKWDDNTQCIKESEQDKIKIQTKCNMEEYEEYRRRMERLENLKKNREYMRIDQSSLGKRRDPESDPESVQSESAKYKKI